MQRQRLRTKAACENCRARKIKCNGESPCSPCVRYGYECIYVDHSRKRRSEPLVSQRNENVTASGSAKSPVPSSPVQTAKPSSSMTSPQDHASYMEANAGAIFPQVLGVKLSSSEAPKAHGIGWNLGLRTFEGTYVSSVCSLISQPECEAWTEIYFDKVHPVYGFLDRTAFEQVVSERWLDAQGPANDSEPLISGVALLGLIFSGTKNHEQEYQLAECARSYLEDNAITRHSTVNIAKGWLLRTLYLRVSSTPQAAWIVSCTAMHVIEDAGLHQERGKRSLVYADTGTLGVDVETQRRLYWLTHLLHTFISQEYGRSTVSLRGFNCELPSARPGDYTAELMTLFKVSQSIDPDIVHDAATLERRVTEAAKLDMKHHSLKLSQSNLILALYRRIRATSSSVSSKTISVIIQTGLLALDSALSLAHDRCPWWHVLNQPFQFLCILLAIDTQESLGCVPQAMKVLTEIANVFETQSARTAVETAQLLIRISRKRKEQEAAQLGQLETISSSAGNSSSSDADNTQISSGGQGTVSTTGLWSEDPETLNQMINDFDWDSFLSYPVPFSD